MNPEIDRIRSFIERQSWTFAKTYAKTSPHEWLCKDKLEREEEKQEFEYFVTFIREHGCRKKFKKSFYTHFDLDGFSYWTMGAPLEITIIINRHGLGFYDHLADEYDRIFSDDESKIENEQIAKMLAPHAAQGKILDIGCGTGLFLDIGLGAGEEVFYHGIDPSRRMLANLSAKHKTWQLSCTTFEEFPVPENRRYDLICSLFGAMSYVNPASFGKLRRLLAPGGKFFLMFYKKGYFPRLYQRTGMCFSHFQTNPKAVEEFFGNSFDYSNYLVATNIELDEDK